MFCSSANAAADGLQSSLGNPYYARIKISNFNPDVDVVTVCAMCPDTPCVTACTVDPDPATGRKAIYRDPSSGVIRADASRCVACGSCEAACVTGTIRLDKPRNKPMGMCSLCDGDPQCVKRCPFGALSMTTVDVGREFFGQRPEVIFKVLSKRLYGGI
jgi:Fe-S-cluster-containing hydrogenase component 2